MDTNKMREQFEAAIVAMKMATGMPEDDAKSFLEVGSNGYTSVYTKAAWWAWQASREALVIELPGGYDPYRANGDPDMLNVNDTIQECREAIEAQGLKVAP